MCILSNFMHGTKLRGVVDTPYAMLYHVHTSGCASTGWRKESTRISWNSIKNNAKYLGRNSPMCLYKLGMNQGPTQRMTWWAFHRIPLCTLVEKKREKKESVLGFIKQSVISRQGMRSFPSAHHWWDTLETSPAESHGSEQQIEASVTRLQAEESQLPAVEVEVQTESYQSICILDGGKWRRWILDCSQWCPVAGLEPVDTTWNTKNSIYT